MATRRVKFIGPTATKRDNVCRSNLFWKFRGAIQVAPEDIAIRLFTHFDVWVEAGEDDEGLPMDSVSPFEAMKTGLTRDDRIKLAINIIETDDCLLEVEEYFGMDRIDLSEVSDTEDQDDDVDTGKPNDGLEDADDIIGDGFKEAAKLSDVIAFSVVREDAVIEAINALDRDSETHFTKDGIPRVEAISGLLGYEVAASERTAAWDTIQEGEGS